MCKDSIHDKCLVRQNEKRIWRFWSQCARNLRFVYPQSGNPYEHWVWGGRGKGKNFLEYFEFGLAATILTASCQYYIAYCTFCIKNNIIVIDVWNECGKTKYSKPQMDLHKLRNWFSSELLKKDFKCLCKTQLTKSTDLGLLNVKI